MGIKDRLLAVLLHTILLTDSGRRIPSALPAEAAVNAP